MVKNAPYIYRGQVFILRETDDAKSPFVAEIVNGGIEYVMPPPKLPFNNYIRKNDTVPEIQEDSEYFAVVVTPETLGDLPFSRSLHIEVPLLLMLTGVSKRMPWILVLKRKNHFEYFRNIERVPLQVNEIFFVDRMPLTGGRVGGQIASLARIRGSDSGLRS